MTLDAETAGIDNLTALAEYIDHFNVHYRLLLRRYKRFQEIDDIYNTDIDVITYTIASYPYYTREGMRLQPF